MFNRQYTIRIMHILLYCISILFLHCINLSVLYIYVENETSKTRFLKNSRGYLNRLNFINLLKIPKGGRAQYPLSISKKILKSVMTYTNHAEMCR